MASANVANTLVVPVESKVAPFYDDFDEAKNFNRILFRPGYAVQARELTQIQTIMQNQIERFGRHIFVNGSSVIGGKIDLTEVVTLNLATQFANTDIVVSNFNNKTIKYGNGNNAVIAKVVQVSAGNETQPPSLHVKYISGDEFGPGSTIKTTDSNNFATLVSTSNVSAPGLASFVYDSVYFVNGYFIKVPSQAIILSKYDRLATLRVGLELQDSIVTETNDTSLLDPALESSNYQAPGAARFRSDLVYSSRPIDSLDDTKFIQLARLTDGSITERNTLPVYSEIEEVLARRTYDESGNYIIKPFLINVEDSPTDPANNFLLSISSGKAYLFGYETERQTETKIELPRARETNSKTNYNLNLNYGNYVIVEDLTGIFNTVGVGIVDMHCVAQSAISYANTTTYNSTKIGTIRVRDLEFYSGEANVAQRKYELYFFDSKFKTLTGTARGLANTTSEIELQANNTASVADAYAGAYIKINSGIGSGDLREIATYNNITKTATVLTPFTTNTTSNTVYTISFDIGDVDSFAQVINFTPGATVNATATIAGVSKDNGSLSGNTIVSEPDRTIGFFKYPEKFIAPGTTNESYVYRRVYNGVQFISGTSSVLTASTDEDFVGATASSNTASTVLDNFLVIVSDNQSSGRVKGEQVKITTDITTSTPEQATLSTGNSAESFIATVYSKMNAFGSAAQPRVKTLVKANTKNFTSDTAANTFVGPTGSTAIVYPNAGQVVILNPSKETSGIESLYLSDVIGVVKIYSFSGNSSPSANASISGFTDVTSRYQTDSGQRGTHYDHAAIRLRPGYAPPSGNLIVCCRAFKTGNDTGYFSVDSYPNLATIVTEEGTSIGTGYNLIPSYGTLKLSDAIDFRPVRPNASNTENFSFNTSRIPVPMTDFQSDYSHYLPRRDLISLNLNRQIELIQGKSQVNPFFPVEPHRNLTLQRLALNPYTISKSDVVIENVDHRRYTMKDIGSIDRRLKNVEYSVSLSALEAKATDILIEDVDGLDRTKYGILAEPFRNHLLGDTASPDYACAVDTIGKYSGTDGMLMPRLASNYFKLRANTSTATGVSVHDDKIMLSYSTEAAISQTVATKSAPIAEYLFADFRGDIVTIPEADIWKNTTVIPDNVISVPKTPVRPQDRKVVIPPPPPDDNGGGEIVGPGPGPVTVVPPVYEMLLALTNSGSYGGLGGLIYDKTTGTFRNDNSTTVVVGGVSQTAGITFGQAANYIEEMMIDQTGTTIDIKESDVRFVAAAYADILNRPAEGGGLAYWSNIYATGNYTEAEMYQIIFNGAISSGELLTVTENTFSTTPSTIIPRDQHTYSGAALTVTERFQNLQAANYTDNKADDNITRTNTLTDNISDLYESVLGRTAEAAGLEYWVGVAAEQGIEAATAGFLDIANANRESGIESNVVENVFSASSSVSWLSEI